jgi:hypothetical protein
LSSIVVADLTDWAYRPRRDQVVVDPELGRIAFGARAVPRRGVWVTYHYAFADAMGGGEYLRDRTPVPATTRIYRVGPGQEFERITDAYERWKADDADGEQRNGIIEITHSGSYQEQLEFVLDPGESLELRAAEGTRPTLRLLDWYSNRPDSLQIRGTHGNNGNNGNNGDSEGGENGGSGRNSGDDSERAASGTLPRPRFRLDGLLITGRGVSVTGPVGSVSIRHSTLVPGWSLEPHCAPTQPEEPSLVLEDTTACVQIDHSILGTILVITDEVHADPLQIHIADSILDATGRHREALSAPECRHAHAILHAYRTTVIGEVHTHAVQIGEDSIFDGHLNVARRGIGCLRFCYVQPGSRTPRRYHCQPDLVWVALREQAERGGIDPADLPRLRETEAERVRPQFTSRRYGTPAYGQLAAGGPAELARGAEDGAELGLYHNLFQPQREDNLRARLVEFAPAGTDAGIVFVT